MSRLEGKVAVVTGEALGSVRPSPNGLPTRSIDRHYRASGTRVGPCRQRDSIDQG